MAPNNRIIITTRNSKSNTLQFFPRSNRSLTHKYISIYIYIDDIYTYINIKTAFFFICLNPRIYILFLPLLSLFFLIDHAPHPVLPVTFCADYSSILLIKIYKTPNIEKKKEKPVGRVVREG